MATAEGVLDFFRRQDGLGESPPGSNCNWLTEWYGMGCVPWCAIGVSRALGEAGFGHPDDVQVPGVTRTTRKGWAYVPYVRKNFADAGRYITDRNAGQPGDLVVFDWDGDGVGDHIGVVETRLSDGTYLTREANTSSNALHQRRRPQSLIAGFCRPPYDSAGGPPPAQPESPGAGPAWPGRYLRYPPVTVGDDVRAWQGRMAARGWRIAVDGAYGPGSREVCRRFQSEKRLGVDGIVGPATWRAAWAAPVT
jgi:hypothetical protein